jgi:flagellar assembly protein FliH
MGLIKSDVAPAKVASFKMVDVERHAAGLILKAKQQAEALLREAELEGDRIRASRYEEGLREGKAAGLQQGLAEGRKQGHDAALAQHSKNLEGLVAAFAGASAQLEASRRKLETETVADVVRLSVAIARRVTKQLGQSDPSVARANVAEALRMVVNASGVKVAIHPAEMKSLEEDLPKIRAMFPKLQLIELVADESLARGGCRLLTGSGIVDADLDAQLDRVVADLLPPGMLAPV